MAERLKILLAESDQAASRTIAEGLRGKGLEVIVASDALHVQGMARDLGPDAIVMSAQLAGGAVGALMRVRSNVYTTQIPVIGIAANPIQQRQMEEAGARDCVRAPVDIGALETAINRNRLQELDFTRAPAAALEAPARMAELNDTRLLDSPLEESFDRLTRLASELLGAPVALVSLVDKDRQFFKSQMGLAEPWASSRETDLPHSFCQWVVSGNEPLIVEDAQAHPVLRSNLAIQDLGVIAYAGVPLRGRAGQPIGSFCAIDSKPRAWSADDVDTLEDLARVTRAYAVLHHAKKDEGSEGSDGSEAERARDLEISASVAGHAIAGAGSILRRRFDRLAPESRAVLHLIIAEQAAHLTRAA